MNKLSITTSATLSTIVLFLLSCPLQAQTKTQASPTPQKQITSEEYSRGSQEIILGTPTQDQSIVERLDKISSQLQGIARRLDRLEAKAADQNGSAPARDDKSKALLNSLDIITKGEQRVESLRKQLFEVMDKESAMKARIDQLDIDARPENIERSLAFSATLRADEVREARRKAIEAERRTTQQSLVEIQSLRTGLEASLAKAEALVEKLRAKFEKDIDAALGDN